MSVILQRVSTSGMFNLGTASKVYSAEEEGYMT